MVSCSDQKVGHNHASWRGPSVEQSRAENVGVLISQDNSVIGFDIDGSKNEVFESNMSETRSVSFDALCDSHFHPSVRIIFPQALKP